MIQIKSEGRVSEVWEYFIEYRWMGELVGFQFPCNSSGDINFNEFSEIDMKNYDQCENDPRMEYMGMQRRCTQSRTPRIGVCYCGDEIVLSKPRNICRCGLIFNNIGEQLVQSKPIEEDDEED